MSQEGDRLAGVSCVNCSYGLPASNKRWLEKIQMKAGGFYYLLFYCRHCSAVYPIVGLKSAFPWLGARPVATVDEIVQKAERARKALFVGEVLELLERMNECDKEVKAR